MILLCASLIFLAPVGFIDKMTAYYASKKDFIMIEYHNLIADSNEHILYKNAHIEKIGYRNKNGENLSLEPHLTDYSVYLAHDVSELRYYKSDAAKAKKYTACLGGNQCFLNYTTQTGHSDNLFDLCAHPLPPIIIGPSKRRFRPDDPPNELAFANRNSPPSYRRGDFPDWNRISFAKTRYDRPKDRPVPKIDSPCINARKDYFENEYNYIKNERKNGISYIYDPLDNYDFDFVRKWFYLFELSPKYDLDFPDYLSIDDAGYARPSRKFWVSPYPVTQSEFRRLMGFNPSYFVSCGGNCPAENLTWHQAIAYANAKSRAEQLETCYVMNQCNRRFASCKDVSFKGLDCRGYRLMTDEEWHWLAKQDYLNTTANADLRHNNGEDYAWTMRNSKVSYFGCIREKCYGLRSCLNNLNVLKDGCFGTHPAGTRKLISLGLHDFYGNVGTWVWDWHGFASKSGDSLGPDFGFCKIVRGTNFFTNEGSHDSRARHCYPPDKGSGLIGARLVRTQDGWIDDKDIE